MATYLRHTGQTDDKIESKKTANKKFPVTS